MNNPIRFSGAPRRRDVGQANELDVESHLPLVRRIAWQVRSRMSQAIEIDDLVQIGTIALIEAAQNFEERGIAFTPYAATRIRGAMIDMLRRNARMSRAGMANRRYLAQVRARLENEYMREPDAAEMTAATGLSADEYFAMLDSTQPMGQESIDESYSDHDMWFADLGDQADTALQKQQLQETLTVNLTKLSEREAMILHLYFVEERSLDNIGDTLNIGAARVCQIKKAALEKMRTMMEESDAIGR